MTRVVIDEDCGNSPKNLFVQEFTIALVKCDLKSILDRVTDDVRWIVPGEKVIQGKDRFTEALEQEGKAVELSIRHIATHGKTGAVDGMIKTGNGKTLAFCNVYEFSNAKGVSIKEIITYRVEVG